jgi:hypothetical protein
MLLLGTLGRFGTIDLATSECALFVVFESTRDVAGSSGLDL